MYEYHPWNVKMFQQRVWRLKDVFAALLSSLLSQLSNL